MKPTRIIVIISITVCLILSCGCAKNSDNNSNSNSDNTNASSIDNTSTNSQDIRITEAKKVITDYFAALKDPDVEASNKFCTDHFKRKGLIRIKDADLIDIAEDVGEKQKNNYLKGRGTITEPYDVLCFQITYNIQYEDEKQATEPNGEKQKWVTLIKETETSPWKIDEMGY